MQKYRYILRSVALFFAVGLAFYLGRFTISETPEKSIQASPISKRSEGISSPNKGKKGAYEFANLVVESHATNVKSSNEAEELRERLLAWAEKDPIAALRFALTELHPLPQKEMALTAILAQWAAEEPGEAWEWAQQHSPNDLIGLLFEIGKVEPEMAWENANNHILEQPEDTFIAYMSALGGVIHYGDYERGVELIEGLDLPYTVDTKHGNYTFLTPVIAEWVRYSPEEVAEWITALPDAHDSAKKSLAHNALLPHWSYSDPVATLDYAVTLPENEAKRMSLTTALQALTERGDFDTATAWLNENATGSGFDSYIHTLATNREMMEEFPEIAIEWADSISTPRVREESLVGIAATVFRQDPDRAGTLFSDILSDESWHEVRTLVERMEQAQFDTLHGDHGEGRPGTPGG